MRLTIVILLAIFGIVLCLNLSASTYLSWQRFRNDRTYKASEFWPGRRQRDFDNCLAQLRAYPLREGWPIIRNADDFTGLNQWRALYLECDKFRKAVP